MSEPSDEESFQGECVECGAETTFSEDGRFGLLACDECGYTPPASRRAELRANAQQEGGEAGV